MPRLAVALAIACLIFLACLANNSTAKTEPVVLKGYEQAPLCADPFAKFTGIQFEFCDRVNRYWDV